MFRRAWPNRIGGLTIIDQVIVLNCSHELTEQSRHRLAALCDARECLELGIPGLRQLDLAGDVPAQVRAAVDALGWSTRQWQTTSFVVVLPALSLSATILAAEVHGRTGHFPPVVQVLAVDGPIPKYEVAGVIGLQQVRDGARTTRAGT